MKKSSDGYYLMTTKGSCLCGRVTFEVDRFTGPFEICHCNRCRKVSGSQGVAAIGCSPKDFRLLTGSDSISTFDAPILHRPPAYRVSFCMHCGSPVPPAIPEGEFMEIAAGLLDDSPGIKPDKHIFIELTPQWDEISDDLPQLTVEELVRLRRSSND